MTTNLSQLCKSVMAQSFSRYVSVGAFSNITLYILYIVLTRLHVYPHVAMTITFVMGVLLSYFLNKNWSFASAKKSRGLVLFSIIYVTAYFLQLGLFHVIYKQMGVPHEIAILISAGFIVLLIYASLRRWVFVGVSAPGPDTLR